MSGGSFLWQPPEKSKASLAADIWAAGAVVHFMALGRPPVADRNEHMAKVLAERRGRDPSSRDLEESEATYWEKAILRKVTPINVKVKEQKLRKGEKSNPVYSDWLNGWMYRMLDFKAYSRNSSATLLQEMIPQAINRMRDLDGEAATEDLELSVMEGTNEKLLMLCKVGVAGSLL